MAIEIRELVIKTTIIERSAEPAQRQQVTPAQRDEILSACRQLILNMLRERGER